MVIKYLFFFFTALLFVGSSFGQDSTTFKLPETFEVKLQSPSAFHDMDGDITIEFIVENLSSQDRSICKRNSPLEGQILSDFFEIRKGGETMKYKGLNIERMAVTENEYISLNSLKAITVQIDLNKAYEFLSPGVYSVSFKGSEINGLPDSEPISITIQ